jgi:hypothetical protein
MCQETVTYYYTISLEELSEKEQINLHQQPTSRLRFVSGTPIYEAMVTKYPASLQ